jgi:TP901 family phage tail tape measure protein
MEGDGLDQFGLHAQYSFTVKQSAITNMQAVRSQLVGLQEDFDRAVNTLNQGNLAGGIAADTRAVQAGVRGASRTIGSAASSMKQARQQIAPLRQEFKALRAAAANIDFGDITNEEQFKRASRASRTYIRDLKALQDQVIGDTAIEREFSEVLKRQQTIMAARIKMQRAEREAANAASRYGQFDALQTVSKQVLRPLASEATGALNVFAAFDNQMSAVAAISEATSAEMEQLRRKAADLGSTTRYTAAESAQAMTFLAQSGFRASQVLEGVTDTLSLASAGELGLGRAAEIASSTLNGFQLAVSDIGKVTDIMAKTAASSNANIEDLGTALSYAAPNAVLFGATIEETSAAIAIMSNAGIKGDRAGTAMRGSFLRLASPTLKAKSALDQLGVSVVGTDGNMRNIVDIFHDLAKATNLDPKALQQLQTVTTENESALTSLMETSDTVSASNLSALKDIFSTVGISGAAAILSNVDQLDQLVAGLKASEGAAKNMAKVMENNLQGSFRAFASAVEAVQIGFIKPITPLIRSVIDAATQFLLFMSRLPAPVRGFVSVLGLMTIGLAAAGVAIGTTGALLFGFSQSLATATAATTALSQSAIPLTGFFAESMAAFKGTSPIASFTSTAQSAWADFVRALRMSGGDAVGIFEALYIKSLQASRGILLFSRSLIFSPFGATIATLVILNAVLEQVAPGINTIGVAVSAITAPIGFVFGFVKGLAESIFKITGTLGEGILAPIVPIFETIGNALEMATRNFERFSTKGEDLGLALGNAIVGVFQNIGGRIAGIWQSTINAIARPLQPFVSYVRSIGEMIVGALAEHSPGPTYQIREKWAMTVAFLQHLFAQVISAAHLVNAAFLGIGEVTPEEQATARQTMFEGLINTLISGVEQLANVGKVWQWVQDAERHAIEATLQNLDFFSFSLLTFASLPATMVKMLRTGFQEVMPELTLFAEHGIPRAIALALPGAVAIATMQGLLKGFERGFSSFLDTIPSRLHSLGDNLMNMIDAEMRLSIEQGLSSSITRLVRGIPSLFPGAQEFTFTLNLDEAYQSWNQFIDGPLSTFIEYLHAIGDTSRELSKNLVALLTPFLTFQPVPFLPPLIPFFTTLLPLEKALFQELPASPALQGIMAFLTGTALPTALRTIQLIATSIGYVVGTFTAFPVIAVVDYLTEGFRQFLKTLPSVQQQLQIIGVTLQHAIGVAANQAVQATAKLLNKIPGIGDALQTSFLSAASFISAVAPKYFNVLIKFFRRVLVSQLLGLLPQYQKLFAEIGQGIVYAFQHGMMPLFKLFPLMDPFRLFYRYLTTSGFRRVFEPGTFGLNYINPFDFVFGSSNKAVLLFTQGMKLMYREAIGAAFPINMIKSKQADILQVLASPVQFRKAARLGLKVSADEITGIMASLIKGIMLISPITQIIGRIGISMLFWYNILKPLNNEMLTAIGNMEVMGVRLKGLEIILRVARFAVVNLTDAFFAFSLNLPQIIKTITTTFDVLGKTIGGATHAIVGTLALFANLLKATIINPLTFVLGVIPLGIVDAVLIGVRETLNLVKAETLKYGDAIVALMHGNFGPLGKALAEDFIITPLRLAYLAFSKTVGRLLMSVLRITGSVMGEVVTLITDPWNEIPRLFGLLQQQTERTTKAISNLVQQLQLDKIATFLGTYWMQLTPILAIALRLAGVIGNLQFGIGALVGVIAILVHEYQTGFQGLDALIRGIQHPIDALNTAISGILKLMGLYISPGFTEFVGNITEQFIKFLPVITAGVFVVALLIKRDIGGAITSVVNGVMGIVGAIMSAVHAVQNLGDSLRDVVGSAKSQSFLGEVAHKVRSRNNIAGFANPLAYSQDPEQQQRGRQLGQQRTDKVRAAMAYQQELNKQIEKLKKDEERNLYKMARSRSRLDRTSAMGGEMPTEDGHSITMKPLVKKERDRFGIERMRLTELGSAHIERNLRERVVQGDGTRFADIRRRAAQQSGLNTAFSSYGTEVPSKQYDSILKALARGGEGAIGDMMHQFRDALQTTHIKEQQVDTLYVRKIHSAEVPKDQPINYSVFDKRLQEFQQRRGLPQQQEGLIRTVSPLGSLRGALEQKQQSVMNLPAIQRGMGFMRTLEDQKWHLPDDAPLTDYRDRLKAVGKDMGAFNAVLNEILNEIAVIQTERIRGVVPDFANFEQLNREAILAGQEMSVPIATGMDAIVDGFRNVVVGARTATDEAGSNLQATRKGLGQILLGATGIPQLIENIKQNRRIYDRMRTVVRRTERLAQRDAQDREIALAARSRGLAALMSNQGFTYNKDFSTKPMEDFFKAKNMSAPQIELLRNFIETRRFERKVQGDELKRVKGAIAKLGGDFVDAEGWQDLHKSLERFTAVERQAFNKFLEVGRKGLSGTEISQLEGAFNSLGVSAAQLNQFQNKLIEDSTTAVTREILRTGKLVARIDSERTELARSLGLPGVGALRQIHEQTLRNPLEQLKVNLNVWMEGIERQARAVDSAITTKISSIEANLRGILPGRIAQAIVFPIDFLYTKTRDTFISQLRKHGSVLVEGAKDVAKLFTFPQLTEQFKAIRRNIDKARANSLSALTDNAQMPTSQWWRNGRRPDPLTQFQNRMMEALQQSSGFDHTKAAQVVSTFLKEARGTDITTQLKGAGLDADVVKDKLRHILQLTADQAEAVMTNPNYTAKAIAPYQWFLLKSMPGLIRSAMSDFSKLSSRLGATFIGRGVSLAAKGMRAVVTDIFLALGGQFMGGLSKLSQRTGLQLQIVFNNLGQRVRGVVGDSLPFLTNTLSRLSNYFGAAGKQVAGYFADQQQALEQGRRESFTAIVIDKAGQLFRKVGDLLGAASEKLQPSRVFQAIGKFVQGVRTFFKDLFANPELDAIKSGIKTSRESIAKEQAKITRAQAVPNMGMWAREIQRMDISSANKAIARHQQELAELTTRYQNIAHKYSPFRIFGKIASSISEKFQQTSNALGKKAAEIAAYRIRLNNQVVEPEYAFTERGFEQISQNVRQTIEYVTPLAHKTFAQLAKIGQGATATISNYFAGAARRSVNAWQNAQRELEGKSWNRWIKIAYKVGRSLVMTLNHGAADVVRNAWTNTQESVQSDMHQMADTAVATGRTISRNLEGAARHSAEAGNKFLGQFGKTLSGLGRAGLSVGGAVGAIGIGAQTIGYSLSNLGILSEEQSGILYKFGEIVTLMSALGGIGTPVFTALFEGLRAVGLTAGTVSTSITGMGGAIASFIGMESVAFAPLVLGVAAIAAAAAGLYFAFKTNFLGIRTLAEGVGGALKRAFAGPIQFIENAWHGLIARFGDIFLKIIQPAISLGQMLINALNHSPTETIGNAWDALKVRIQGVFEWMVATAQSIGSAIVSIFSPAGNFFSGLFKRDPQEPAATPSLGVAQLGQSVANKASQVGQAVTTGASQVGQAAMDLSVKALSAIQTQLVNLTNSVNLLRQQIVSQIQALTQATQETNRFTSAIFSAAGIAVMGKILVGALGLNRLFKGLTAFRQLLLDLRSPLDNLVARAGLRSAPLPSRAIGQVASAEGLKGTISALGRLGEKLRPVAAYIPAIALLSPEIGTMGTALVGLSYALNEVKAGFITWIAPVEAMIQRIGGVEMLLPVIGSVTAAFATVFILLEAVTTNVNILGTVIGSVFAVFKAFGGLFQGIKQAFDEAFKPVIAYFDDVQATIERLGKAGEEFGRKIGYQIGFALTHAITTIRNAWIGFINWFGEMPLVDIAVKIGQGLINALNHSPTVQIPIAWEGAISHIQGLLGGFLDMAKGAGQAVISLLSPIFSPVGNFFANLGTGGRQQTEAVVTAMHDQVATIASRMDSFSTLAVSSGDALTDIFNRPVQRLESKADNLFTVFSILAQTINQIPEILNQILIVNQQMQALLETVTSHAASIEQSQKDNVVTTKASLGRSSVAGTGTVATPQKENSFQNLAHKLFVGRPFQNWDEIQRNRHAAKVGADIGQEQRGTVPQSGFHPIESIKLAWSRQGLFEEAIQKELQEREIKLVDQIIKASNSSSLYVRQQYQDLVTTNAEGRKTISGEGQAYIEKQLAQMAQSQTGVFSSKNLESVAKQVGFKPGKQDLLDTALMGQGAIADTAKELDRKTASPEEKWLPDIAATLKQLAQTAESINAQVQLTKIPQQIGGGTPERVLTQAQAKLNKQLSERIKIPEALDSGSAIPVPNHYGIPQTLQGGMPAKIPPIQKQLGNEWWQSLTLPVGLIQGRWMDFTKEFGNILFPIVGFAENVGNLLIGALNCNPTVQIPLAWQNAVDFIKGLLSQLLDFAGSVGRKVIDVLNPFKKRQQATQVVAKQIRGEQVPVTAQVGNVEATQLNSQANHVADSLALRIQDRIDFLKRRGVGDISVLFQPGFDEVKGSISTLAGDFVDFGTRAAKAVLTLNFVELGDAINDFRGNFLFAAVSVISGFGSMALSAIAFAVASLPAISPMILVLGGIAFAAAAILANFLGIRTILKGVLQVGLGTGQVLLATFRGVLDIVSSLGVVARGIFRALHGDFTLLDQGIQQVKDAMSRMLRSLQSGLGTIRGGVRTIFKGIQEGIAQIFPSFDSFTGRIKEMMHTLRDGGRAGELAAEALIKSIRWVIGVFHHETKRAASTFNLTIPNLIGEVKARIATFVDYMRSLSWREVAQRLIREFVPLVKNLERLPGALARAMQRAIPALAAPFDYMRAFARSFTQRIAQEIPPELVAALRQGAQQAATVFRKVFGSSLEEFTQRVVLVINYMQVAWNRFTKFLLTSLNQFDRVFAGIVRLGQGFTIAVSDMGERWTAFRHLLSRKDILAGFFAKIQPMGEQFAVRVEGLEARWRQLATQIKIIPLFTPIFSLLKELGLRWTLTTDFLERRWQNLRNFIVHNELIPQVIETVKWLGTVFTDVMRQVRAQWGPFVQFLNTSDIFPRFFAKLRELTTYIPVLVRSTIAAFSRIDFTASSLIPRLAQLMQSAIERIGQAWKGFISNFDTILSGAIAIAKRVGQALINLLNHSPTIKIPQAWSEAIGKITELFKGWIQQAAATGQAIVDTFISVVNRVKSGVGAVVEFFDGVRAGFRMAMTDSFLEMVPAVKRLLEQIAEFGQSARNFLRPTIGALTDFVVQLYTVRRGLSVTIDNFHATGLVGKRTGEFLAIAYKGVAKTVNLLASTLTHALNIVQRTTSFFTQLTRGVIRVFSAVGQFARGFDEAFAAKVMPAVREVLPLFGRLLMLLTRIGAVGGTLFAVGSSVGGILAYLISHMNGFAVASNFAFAKLNPFVAALIGIAGMTGLTTFMVKLKDITKGVANTFQRLTNVIEGVKNGTLTWQDVGVMAGESVGKTIAALIRGFGRLLQAVVDLGDFITRPLRFVDNFLRHIATVTVNNLITSLERLGGPMRGLVQPLIGNLQKLSNSLSTVRQDAQSTAQGFNVTAVIGNRLRSVIDGLSQAFSSFIQYIGRITGITAAIERVTGFFTRLGKTIYQNVTAIRDYVSGFWQGFSGKVQPAVQELTPVLARLGVVFGRLGVAITAIGAVAGTAYAAFTGLNALFGVLDSSMGGAAISANRFFANFNPVVSAVITFLGAIGGGIVFAKFKDIIGGIADFMGRTRQGMQGAKEAVEEVRPVIENTVRTILSAKEMGEMAGKALGDSVVLVITALKNLFTVAANIGEAITNPISFVDDYVKEFAVRIGDLLTAPLHGINSAWEATAKRIGGLFKRLRGQSKQTGADMQGDLAEHSPGPTFMIRRYWGLTTEFIEGRLDSLAQAASAQGSRIGDAMRNSLPTQSLNSNVQSIANYQHLITNASDQQRKSILISRAAIEQSFAREQQIAEKLHSGVMSQSMAEKQLMNVQRQRARAQERFDRTAASIQEGMTRRNGELVNSSRSALTSVGAALANFAPGLATPLFMLNDFVDVFSDLRGLLPQIVPRIRDYIVTNWALAQSHVATATATGVASGATFTLATAFTFLGNAAKAAYTTLVAPLIPLLPLILGITAAVFLMYQVFKNNFLGLRDGIMGVVGGFKFFFDLLFGGAWKAIAGVFRTFELAIRAVVSTIREVAGMVMAPFEPLLNLFGITGGGGGLMQRMTRRLIDAILFPLRLVTESIKFVIQAVSAVLQLLIRVGGIIISAILTPLRLPLVIISEIGKILQWVVGSAFKEIGAIAKTWTGTFNSVGKALNQAFLPLFQLFGVKGSGGDFILKTLQTIARAMLIPLQVVGVVLVGILKGVSAIIQGVIKLGGFILITMLQPVRMVMSIFTSIRDIVTGIGNLLTRIGQTIVDTILYPFKQVASLISNIASLGMTGLSNIPFIGQFFTPPTDVATYQTGGFVSRPGWVHQNEFVVTEDATARNLPFLEALNRGQTISPEIMPAPPQPLLLPVQSARQQESTVAVEPSSSDLPSIHLHFHMEQIVVQGAAGGAAAAMELVEEMAPQLRRAIRQILREEIETAKG